LGFGTLAAVIGMLGLSARDLATRFVPPGAHTLELSFLAMATSIPAGLILRAMTGDPFTVPDTRAVLLLGQMIAAATAAYFCVTAAMRLGDISAVAPFRYTRILFAFALAVVVVGEMLSTRMVVGTVLVVGAGLFTLWREQKAARALGSPDRAR
ncbi:MAG: DMT family transporter, partial [Pseudomonadota bacterium]